MGENNEGRERADGLFNQRQNPNDEKERDTDIRGMEAGKV